MTFSNCGGVAIGPTCVSGCIGSPSRSWRAIASTRSVNAALIEFCTSRREPAVHICPVAPKMPETAPMQAWSRSASSNTMLGDLPPSSIDTRFIERAAAS